VDAAGGKCISERSAFRWPDQATEAAPTVESFCCTSKNSMPIAEITGPSGANVAMKVRTSSATESEDYNCDLVRTDAGT
jgi:hypothetical protein